MIQSIQTNKLILICDVCGKKGKFVDQCYIAKDFTERNVFGEKGNYEYARKKKGWMIRNHTCKCLDCKGKSVSKIGGKRNGNG